MTVDLVFLAAFHVLRPWILLAALPVVWIWWRQRHGQASASPKVGLIAPHLAQALTVHGDEARLFRPIDLMACALLLLLLAASGPTWSRVPEPFAAQTAPLVVVMQVTKSMENDDVAPTRQERAKQKVRDLLELRAGARTALVAFAGSAHFVVPMTEDPGVMQPYLEGLSTEVMPKDGRDLVAGLRVAQAMLAREPAAGGVLFVLDDLSASEAASLAVTVETPVETTVSGSGSGGLSEPAQGDGSDAPAATAPAEGAMSAMAFLYMRPETAALPSAPEGAVMQRVTADGRDVAAIERALASAYRRAQLADGDQPWEDRGRWFAWPALLLLLVGFRRGLVVRWAGIAAVGGLLISAPNTAQADGWKDWFFTPDQQGWHAYQNKKYAAAADVFETPYLSGVAQYKDGQYEAAAGAMSRLETADAAFVEGMAHLKSRKYRDGVRAFERAVALDPTHAGAQQNLPIAKKIVTYIEETQAQSDTGEDSGIGADDTVFDNESGQGAETQIDAAEEQAAAHLSTEQWMNTVDTRTSDFLRQRFQLEAARGTP